jgi:hypothetical protein
MTLYNFSYILNGDSSKHVVFALCEGLHIPTAVKSEYIYIVCIFEGVIALYYLENFIKMQLYLHYKSEFPENLLVYNYTCIRICIVLPQFEPALVA